MTNGRYFQSGNAGLFVETESATHGNAPSRPEFGDVILDFLKGHPLQGAAA
ncbi:hypothetical protein [Oryzicola mucosus]|uniref:Alpha/beta hydrolase n=1 Tax=Oryzicola mucosus TaxID=2767425 RepID=A0A8J6PYX1_9HYPH|nr:hypothetical protein [Oryzicola mucosus]MBD0417158.1 hypothetical protein [Oryzicola mucosus]